MFGNLEVSDVEVDFHDVYGQTIRDEVNIKIYNSQLNSVKQMFDVKFKGSPALLRNVPAFPFGHAKMIITPTKYRYKDIQIHVPAGSTKQIVEFFFVEPSKARPRLLDFQDLPAKTFSEELLRILGKSNIGADVWDKLDKRIRATILNLSAKMSRESVAGIGKVIKQVNVIDRTWLNVKHQERIYAYVDGDLLAAMRDDQVYSSVGGGMHKFPPGWGMVDEPNSFKTLHDSAGNIQFTFARNADGVLMADIDLDDHTGIKHVADVLSHKFSGKNTDPYDIHQILWYSQQLDAEYRLL